MYNFELEEYELFFYAKDSVAEIKNWDQLYDAMEKPGTWVYTNATKYNDIKNMDYSIDTVYTIRQRGMNEINLQFLDPATREESLKSNYLIKTGNGKN